MTASFSIFCKTHEPDLDRVIRLAASVERYNADGIPLYISCPEQELALFKAHLSRFSGILLFSDQEILDKTLVASPAAAQDLKDLSGSMVQQIVKAEFWRMGFSDHYLVIDSDSYFIRPFYLADFLTEDTIPYTVCHECKDLLAFAARKGRKKVIRDYRRMRESFQTIFSRSGRLYDFGPTPVIWSTRVWQELYETYAVPNRTHIVEMILRFPCELLWYGEALMHQKSIPLLPVEPLFKVFHYQAQFEESQGLGETDAVLAKNYLGVVMQSNWDRARARSARSGFRALVRRLLD